MIRIYLHALLGAFVSVTGANIASADVWIVGVDGAASVSGTTTTIEGDQFDAGGSSPRWDNLGVIGTDLVATTNSVSTDRYFIITANIAALNLTVADNRYVEIFYSSDLPWTGDGSASDHRFFLSDTGQGNNGENSQDSTLVPTSVGAHSFVIDLLSTDGTTLDGDFGPTETWDQLRWDMWNKTANPANQGITFTLDKVVFGGAVTIIPEPNTLALLVLSSVGLFVNRRNRPA
ncbi:PEP-CTERM sorting domain-containing protein [Bythopirellula polymerisocia]|uniref:PEP-CTERM protein-sorting domain-containing protein n=1 Tax=Bythopirellula polymerisocia TaxID=2528003 RepID=A0A5C6CUJ7_9BACT|nr:PEP-CTERM sorting domain-containing protein [Bythopirellula polymerisocia]TWU28643.1 hypothetical protein Pla144_19350 [Bythopirellula polymerisocia]